ncbi:hypothetical protein HOT32_gp11 [Erwinia phage Faunus]|uniref:Uncharacterized protein n=1 Tax=Erwinia phage Faunus TaxID=2182346 RepID=A0A2U8UWU7_9CAUD|nr:hypothetical protein HOT32_gp11 [Erwinia phage Faunus]AWN08594.1 hypothetical protein [Erwinia phage Faunus]
MNKGSVIKFIGETFVGYRCPNLTKGKKYKVIAGKGDGVPRNNGTLGAFIQTDDTVVISDDLHNYKIVKINSNWEVVSEAESGHQQKPVSKDPIPVNKEFC